MKHENKTYDLYLSTGKIVMLVQQTKQSLYIEKKTLCLFNEPSSIRKVELIRFSKIIKLLS